MVSSLDLTSWNFCNGLHLQQKEAKHKTYFHQREEWGSHRPSPTPATREPVASPSPQACAVGRGSFASSQSPLQSSDGPAQASGPGCGAWVPPLLSTLLSWPQPASDPSSHMRSAKLEWVAAGSQDSGLSIPSLPAPPDVWAKRLQLQACKKVLSGDGPRPTCLLSVHVQRRAHMHPRILPPANTLKHTNTHIYCLVTNTHTRAHILSHTAHTQIHTYTIGWLTQPFSPADQVRFHHIEFIWVSVPRLLSEHSRGHPVKAPARPRLWLACASLTGSATYRFH